MGDNMSQTKSGRPNSIKKAANNMFNNFFNNSNKKNSFVGEEYTDKKQPIQLGR